MQIMYLVVSTLAATLYVLDYFGFKPVRSESSSSVGGAKVRNWRVLIVISLLVTNSAFSGFDLFRSRSATFSRNEMKSLTPHFQESFIDKTVELDGQEFDKCLFRNVTLVYHGKKPFIMRNGEFNPPLRFKVDDPTAATTLTLLSSMGLVSYSQVEANDNPPSIFFTLEPRKNQATQ
jgi:hypothetical protein